MRKLIVLVTAALAAMAMMALTAAPASADRAFVMTGPNGEPCDPDPCIDTGLEGSFDWYDSGIYYGTCEVRFDGEVYTDGTLIAYDTVVDQCSGSFIALKSCASEWPGQIRLPDTGPARIDISMCIHGTSATWTCWGDYEFTVHGPPRTWAQVAPAWSGCGGGTIEDMAIEDTYPDDNVQMEVL